MDFSHVLLLSVVRVLSKRNGPIEKHVESASISPLPFCSFTVTSHSGVRRDVNMNQ